MEHSSTPEAPRDRRQPRISYTIGALDRSLRRRMRTILRPLSVTIPEYTALSLLRHRDGYSNADLAKRALVTPQAMHEVIRSLEERKIIHRTPSARRGSVRHTYLTEEGSELLDRCDAAVDDMEESMLKGYASEARDQAMALLHHLRRELQASS
jgi:DNA-binding MarR family transcriptional regulator